jgi:hypothetical protein
MEPIALCNTIASGRNPSGRPLVKFAASQLPRSIAIAIVSPQL